MFPPTSDCQGQVRVRVRSRLVRGHIDPWAKVSVCMHMCLSVCVFVRVNRYDTDTRVLYYAFKHGGSTTVSSCGQND